MKTSENIYNTYLESITENYKSQIHLKTTLRLIWIWNIPWIKYRFVRSWMGFKVGVGLRFYSQGMFQNQGSATWIAKLEQQKQNEEQKMG
jgi:hypothetical protein